MMPQDILINWFTLQIIRFAHLFLFCCTGNAFVFPKPMKSLIPRKDLNSLEYNDNVQLLGREVGHGLQVEESISLHRKSEKTQEVSTLWNFLLLPNSAIFLQVSVWHNCQRRESCHSFLQTLPESLHVQFYDDSRTRKSPVATPITCSKLNM